MFLSRVGPRMTSAAKVTKVAPAVASAIQKQGLAPVAAASPLFFTEFNDGKPMTETVFFWAGSTFEELYQKSIEPNLDYFYQATLLIIFWRTVLHFGIGHSTFVRELQLQNGVRWQPGHHSAGPWEAVSHPLMRK